MKFIKSVFAEMKLVTWPTAKETRRDTFTVVATSILFAIYFAVVDWALLLVLNRFIFQIVDSAKSGILVIEKTAHVLTVFYFVVDFEER